MLVYGQQGLISYVDDKWIIEFPISSYVNMNLLTKQVFLCDVCLNENKRKASKTKRGSLSRYRPDNTPFCIRNSHGYNNCANVTEMANISITSYVLNLDITYVAQWIKNIFGFINPFWVELILRAGLIFRLFGSKVPIQNPL